jgi:thiamine-phosphate diphosphorylase
VRPIACLITDRLRRPDTSGDVLVSTVRAAATAGVQLIQLRERDLDGRALFDLAVRVIGAVSGTSARVLINDRLDVALAARAHGIHLRASSFLPSRVRAITPPGFLIGRSVHSADEAVTMAGEGADFLVFGNVFDTASKPGRPGVGLAALGELARVTPLPVLAVGGVTRERVPQLLAAGAAGFAAISLFGDDRMQ